MTDKVKKGSHSINDVDFILEDIAAAVCDGMCTKLDEFTGPGEEEVWNEICRDCEFSKAYDELARILKNFDAEYLKICKENDRIQRRLKLYDLCSDMS